MFYDSISGVSHNPWGVREHRPNHRHHGPNRDLHGEGRGHRHGGGRHGHHRGGGHGLHSGRKLSSSDLHLVLLALLEKTPAHGYELIKSLEEHSDGFYVPSPGMIYPSLTYLEEIGYAIVEQDGNKKSYRLTPEGKSHLDQNRETAQKILDEFAQIGARMEAARRAFDGETPPPKSPFEKTDSLLEAIKNRRSMGLSRMKPDQVDRTLIERMLEAANWAPSHEDTEPWRFTIFSGNGRERLAEIFAEAMRVNHAATDGANPLDLEGARKRAFAAPVWITIGMSPKLNEDGSLLMTEDEELMAVACAVQNLHLMASGLGLTGMWHSKGLSIHPTVAQLLGLTPPARLLGLFMCGWPNCDPITSTRRPVEEKCTWFE